MKLKSIKPLLFFIIIANSAFAQLPSNRMSAGVMHYAGDTVRSIRLGLWAIVPQGWKAVLPRDTEVVVLVPDDNSSSSTIYAVLNENMTLAQQKINLEKGFSLADGLNVVPDGPVTQRTAEVLATNAKLSGAKANTQAKFYIESKCNPVGYCLVFVLQADAPNMEKGKTALKQLVDNVVFEDMSHVSPYANFDWKEFLSNKLLLRFRRDASGKQEDELELCKNGNFKANITRSGAFKVPKEYAGKNKGTWSLTSNNDKATITLTFKKLKPITLEVQGKDEEIYVNGHRYFVGESENCD
ncbi:hypothetical protein WBG78_20925 [Chryseolinea sp. T2]|uniref:hypothetical protein n=1 Tax=Chryseolinea sp. T2 TaxID=3129255 RepID=UPI00307886B1